VRRMEKNEDAQTTAMARAPRATSGLLIVPTFDTSITSDPNAAAIEGAINGAISALEAVVTDPITVNISFIYSTTYPDGTPMTDLGSSFTGYYDISYPIFLNALKASSASGWDASAQANLPSAELAQDVRTPSALARALGRNDPGFLNADATASGGTFDGVIFLNAALGYRFDRTQPITPDLYDAQAILEHEMDEVLGTSSILPATRDGAGRTAFDAPDFFRYSNGELDVPAPGTSPYFSIDGGVTEVMAYNAQFGYDFGDWVYLDCLTEMANPLVQDAVGCPGTTADVSATSPEGILLDVIGYHVNEPAGAQLPQQINVVYPGNTVSYGSVGTISVSATSGLPVTFVSATPAVCTVAGTTASVVGIGACSMTATQGGNAVFSAAPTVKIAITVQQGAQSLTFLPLLDVTLGKGSIPVTATSTAGLPVAFTSATPSYCSVSGSTVTPIAAGTCTVQADQDGNVFYLSARPVSQSFRVLAAGSEAAAAIVSAVSYAAIYAPDSILAAFGSNLMPGTDVATGATVPETLGGGEVTLTDVSGKPVQAPLFYASPGQVNFEIPHSIRTSLVKVEFSPANGSSGPTAVALIQLRAVAPALISADGSSKGVAAGYAILTGPNAPVDPLPIFACDASGCQPTPVSAGSATAPTFLELFGTGIRNYSTSVTCTIGDVAATVFYAGTQFTLLGLDQVDIQVPASLAGVSGPQNIVLTVDGQTANTVTVEFAGP
jgi:uncharacterized protein (TIGR03437 family)